MYRRDIPRKESTFPQRRRTPSFSSSLLDSIYRSTGGEPRTHKEELGPTTMARKQSNSSIDKVDKTKRSNLQKPKVMENWGEKRSSVYLNSASSSSDSSSGVEGGVFSSSEAESINRLKPRISEQRMMKDKEMNQKQQKGFNNDGFTKTKLKALKFYEELKKVKQPISPGGRFTSFLSSIFNSNAKKMNICSAGKTGDVGFERKSKSACSTATSYSRSCLNNKTQSSSFSSSTMRNNNGDKRSVRFYPVNVIIDEDCVKKGNNEETYSSKTEHKRYSGSVNQKRESSERLDDSGSSDRWRNYQRKNNTQLRGFLENYAINDEEEVEEEDDDENEDALSYSSSDLFELDHLIGNGRYGEELPVYETTSLKTNQAIANGIIL